MDLERVSAVIRPRSPWAAIDLGFTMVRSWWRPVYAAWLATVLPVWILAAAIFGVWSPWSLAVVWWLRPLFDRVPLFVVSRTLFGATPTVGGTLRALPKLWRGHLVSALTVYRLDLARSFNLPVWQLEGLRGGARQKRSSMLKSTVWSTAVALTGTCWLMEMGLGLGLLGLVNLFIPDSTLMTFFELGGLIFEEETPTWFAILWRAVGFASFSLVEPFYVAAGFSLYLNRRTRLEGWDVELAFKRLSRRLIRERRGIRRARAVVAIALCCCAGVLALPSPVAAQEGGDQAAGYEDLDPQQLIREILRGEAFQTRETQRRWRLREELLPDLPDVPEGQPAELPALSLGGVVASGARILLAIVVAAGLAVILYYGLRHLRWKRRRQEEPRLAAITVHGPDDEHRPEDLGDVTDRAWKLWQEGRATDALELLYRGALGVLGRRHDLEVGPSFTEEDWIRLIRGRLPRGPSDFFVRLARAWQAAAYAHRSPAGDTVRELCGGWRRFEAEAT